MPVNLSDVEYVAALARLEFTAEEKQRLVHELNEILSYMEKLNELDTSAVEPLSHVIPVEDALREDEVRPSLPAGHVLKNAPDGADPFFRVPKAIGG